jgi:hypothetical protein
MKIHLFILVILFAGSLPANFVCAANPLDVVISEIAWMGTETSATNEWIELYNNTTSIIDITGWTLKSTDDSPNITFEIYRPRGSVNFSIPAKGFWLMERTDDDSVKGIEANFIYTGALNNSGETLELRDADGNLIDAIDSEDGWLAGDNNTKQTMERKNLLFAANADNWQTSAESGGTPNSSTPSLRGAQQGDAAIPPSNSPQEIAASGSTPPRNDEEMEPSLPKPLSLRGAQQGDAAIPLSNSPQPNAEISYPSNIIINEILPSPDGPDSENEWIEIFNQNNFSVDISDWKIADTQGSVKSYTFGDSLDLIHPDGTITDSVVFTKAKLNQSYNRSNGNWVWSDTLTPGWENIIPVAPVAKNITKENSVSNADNKQIYSGPTPVSKTYRGRFAVTAVNTTINFTAPLLALFSAFSILALKKSFRHVA